MIKKSIPYLLSLPLLWVCAYSCTGSTKKKNTEAAVLPPTKELNATFEDGTTHLHKIKQAGRPDTVMLNVRKPGLKMINIVTASDTGNIRINLVISPSGDVDGPFAKTLSKRFGETGTYTIIISESKMKGSNYEGPYDLIVAPL